MAEKSRPDPSLVRVTGETHEWIRALMESLGERLPTGVSVTQPRFLAELVSSYGQAVVDDLAERHGSADSES